jgi:hypothetical protein
MRTTRDLRRLKKAALGRVDRLAAIAYDAATPSGVSDTPRQDHLTSYCVIELHNAWYAFSRSLYLSTCLGARDSSGSRVGVSKVRRATTEAEALGHAVRRCKSWRYKATKTQWSWLDEPAWARSSNLLDALDEVGAANYAQVSASLSLPGATQVLEHLADFRNFYAHRGEDTRSRATQNALVYALNPGLPPTNILQSHALRNGVTRPQPLLMDWVDDARLMIATAI